jgi:hypothetical protein
LTFTTLIYSFISNKKFKLFIQVVSVVFIIFLITHYTTAKIKRIDSIPIGIESILLFVYIFYYFYSSLRTIDLQASIYEKASFWFVIGIFAYLGTTFFFNILASSLGDEQIISYYYLSYFGDIIKNVFFTIAVVLLPKSHPSSLNTIKNDSKVPYLDMI